MKKRATILMAATLIIAACGTAAQYSSSGQRFQDDIYITHTDRTEEKLAAKAEESKIDDLVEQTKGSEIYLLTEDGSTSITVPENTSAAINVGSDTGITVTNNTGATVTIEDPADFNIYINS